MNSALLARRTVASVSGRIPCPVLQDTPITESHDQSCIFGHLPQHLVGHALLIATPQPPVRVLGWLRYCDHIRSAQEPDAVKALSTKDFKVEGQRDGKVTHADNAPPSTICWASRSCPESQERERSRARPAHQLFQSDVRLCGGYRGRSAAFCAMEKDGASWTATWETPLCRHASDRVPSRQRSRELL